MPADRRSRSAASRWRGSGGVRGAVLEAAGGGGARAEGRRHWWWRFRGGRRLHAVSLVCTERRLRARRNRPAACCRRRISGGRWRCCRWCPSICCCTTARYLTGLRSNPPAQGAWFVPGGRIRKNEPLALALDRIAREELGLHAMAAAWTPCGVHEHLLHQLRRRNQPLHPLHRAGLRGRAGAGSGQPAARAASRLPLAVARRHRRRP